MKIAFVDNLPVGGGLSRYSLGLCRNLTNEYPDVVIDYYIHDDNVKRMEELFLIDRVNVIVLKSTKEKGRLALYSNKILRKFNRKSRKDAILYEIENCITSKYDLAYFPTAHMMKRPSLTIPVVGTFHDFNWKYFFGSTIFDKSFVDMMDIETLKWFQNGENITLSEFIANEARNLFPKANNLPHVIHVGSLSVYNEITDEMANKILDDLKINWPYIIFPGNFFPHKNHLNLFTAFSLLKKKKGFENYKLLLTGVGSEQISYGLAKYTGVQLSNELDYDIRGMGYQSNECMDVLIIKAKLMVSPSLYEEMCLPAMDAWSFGTPTALSNIPPFKEHEKVLGIRAAFFDPMNPANIAEVLENYLNDYDKAKSDGEYSKLKMGNNSWSIIAQKYMEVFEKAIHKGK